VRDPVRIRTGVFDGQVAIVTGAGSGIGAAIADRLADEGAQVAVADVDLVRAQTRSAAIVAAGGIALAVQVDVSVPASVAAMVEAVDRAWGRVDVLVNNAGVIGPTVPIGEYPEAAWRRVLSIDLDGTFFCTRAVIPHMLRNGYGRIVNISSIAGKEGTPGMPAYAAAKAGVLGLTKAVGRELAQTGILVNAVTPGGVANTGISSPDVHGLDGEQLLEAAKLVKARTPLGRLGEPSEIAELVAWVASSRCTYTTGGVFDISGGRAQY